eukprot:scaffold233310_cov30-Attheya_sp.AAC.1
MDYLDEEALWKAYRKGQRDHQEICNNADEHRLNFLVDLANARAEANDTNPETELSNLQGWELQRRIHAKIRAVSGRDWFGRFVVEVVIDRRSIICLLSNLKEE